jgi:hypothetical protein
MVSQEWILPIQADSKERRFAIAALHAAQTRTSFPTFHTSADRMALRG